MQNGTARISLAANHRSTNVIWYMRISKVHLKNIGPFRDATVCFSTDSDNGKQPVTIITGLNGSGKSIVIDALRAALSGQKLERDIVADKK